MSILVSNSFCEPHIVSTFRWLQWLGRLAKPEQNVPPKPVKMCH